MLTNANVARSQLARHQPGSFAGFRVRYQKQIGRDRLDPFRQVALINPSLNGDVCLDLRPPKCPLLSASTFSHNSLYIIPLLFHAEPLEHSDVRFIGH